jgi:hypothetical protein
MHLSRWPRKAPTVCICSLCSSGIDLRCRPLVVHSTVTGPDRRTKQVVSSECSYQVNLPGSWQGSKTSGTPSSATLQLPSMRCVTSACVLAPREPRRVIRGSDVSLVPCSRLIGLSPDPWRPSLADQTLSASHSRPASQKLRKSQWVHHRPGVGSNAPSPIAVKDASTRARTSAASPIGCDMISSFAK